MFKLKKTTACLSSRYSLYQTSNPKFNRFKSTSFLFICLALALQTLSTSPIDIECGPGQYFDANLNGCNCKLESMLKDVGISLNF